MACLSDTWDVSQLKLSCKFMTIIYQIIFHFLVAWITQNFDCNQLRNSKCLASDQARSKLRISHNFDRDWSASKCWLPTFVTYISGIFESPWATNILP